MTTFVPFTKWMPLVAGPLGPRSLDTPYLRLEYVQVSDGTRLAPHQVHNHLFPYQNEENNENDFEELLNFRLLSEEEVTKIIKEAPNKYCGLDPLPMSLLKECLPIVIPHMTKIVNLSLQLGDMPISMKKAIVKPLLKKLGLDLIYKNYRPVSNLSFLSKLIEKIVAEQFTAHLERNGLFDIFQSAYKKYHSTETAYTEGAK